MAVDTPTKHRHEVEDATRNDRPWNVIVLNDHMMTSRDAV